MTASKNFKHDVRRRMEKTRESYSIARKHLLDKQGVSSPRLPTQEYYRVRLVVSSCDDDDFVIGDQVVNLSSFPETGSFVKLNDGCRYEVWHPILKARISLDDMVDDRNLPAVCVYAAPVGLASVVEVEDGVAAPPVEMDLHSEVYPTGVRRYVTRPYVAGDGMDIQIKDSFGLSMYGHHVYEGPFGLYLKRETLDVRYAPYRIRLPATMASGSVGPNATLAP